MSNKINYAEWFSGLGAFSSGMSRVFYSENLNLVDSVELDKHSTKSFNAIHSTNFEPRDINDVDVSKYPELDILVAGWPCQDLSVAGKGAGIWGNQMREAIRVFKKYEKTGVMEKLVMEKRSGLIFTTIQNIQLMKTKPKRILLENVKGLVSKRWEKDLKLVKMMFDKLGYTWQQVVLNSKYFGVPQARERVFILLTRKELPQKDITHLAEYDEVTSILKDVLDWTQETHIASGTVLLNKMKQYKDKSITVNIENLKNQDPTKINIVAKLDVPFVSDRLFYGIEGVTGTLVSSNPSFKNKIFYVRNGISNYRKLSVRECWRLMGFSDESFNKVKEAGVSPSQMAKQAGNSIVVNVLEAIIREVL